MIDFNRFWMEGSNPYEEEPDAEEAEVPPGVTAAEIRTWEKTHRVKLPEPIRTALGIRNGGYVRNAPIEVLPLDEIVPVDDDFWEYTELDEDEVPKHNLMFIVGIEIEIGGTFLLNFNARGPKGRPSVYIDHHGESTYLVNDTLSGFFEEQMASSDAPTVDWSETEKGIAILARETIDLSGMYGGPASEEQVLARDNEALVLFTRQRSPEGETLTRTTLPLPLEAEWAKVQPYRPAPMATFSLHLQPEESDGIVALESKTDDDGRWKNSTSHGVPIYVTFESIDRDRLVALRTQLLGAESAARAQAAQDREASFVNTIEQLSPQQRAASLLQFALNMREKSVREFGALGDAPEDAPPGLAEAAKTIQRRMEEMAERFRQQAGGTAPDPELLKRFNEMLRDPKDW